MKGVAPHETYPVDRRTPQRYCAYFASFSPAGRSLVVN
jgi:hypothetical protein